MTDLIAALEQQHSSNITRALIAIVNSFQLDKQAEFDRQFHLLPAQNASVMHEQQVARAMAQFTEFLPVWYALGFIMWWAVVISCATSPKPREAISNAAFVIGVLCGFAGMMLLLNCIDARF